MTTENKNSLFHLELVRKRTLSAQETSILNAFDRGMQFDVLERAAEAARQLNNYCPPLDQEKEANAYLWMVWEIMLDIARSPDVKCEVHICLVKILEMLRQSAKGDLNVWGVSIHHI